MFRRMWRYCRRHPLQTAIGTGVVFFVSTRRNVYAHADAHRSPLPPSSPSLPSPSPPSVLESSSPSPPSKAADSDAVVCETDEHDVVNSDKLCIFSGSANPELTREIVGILDIKMGNARVSRFADGEIDIQVRENIRGKDVYIVQPTGPPVNDNIIELLMMVSSMRRASARRITAVIPYYGYGRQDRKRESRETIAAADIARMLEASGVDRVVAVDLHSGQTQGFFQKLTPVENLSTTHNIVPYFMRKNLHRPVIVGPSGTGLHRVKRFRDEFHMQGIETGVAFVAPKDSRGVLLLNVPHHHRVHDHSQMTLVGDVHDSDVIIVDDMIDTGSRLRLAARTCKQHGANRVYAYSTHGLLSRLEFDDDLDSSDISELVLTNTIAKPEHVHSKKVHYVSVASMLADTILHLHSGMPLSLFLVDYQYN